MTFNNRKSYIVFCKIKAQIMERQDLMINSEQCLDTLKWGTSAASTSKIYESGAA